MQDATEEGTSSRRALGNVDLSKCVLGNSRTFKEEEEEEEEEENRDFFANTRKNDKLKTKKKNCRLPLSLLRFLLLRALLLGAFAPSVEPLRGLGEHVKDRLPV